MLWGEKCILARISESGESTQIIHRLAIQLLASKAWAWEAKADLPTFNSSMYQVPTWIQVSFRHWETAGSKLKKVPSTTGKNGKKVLGQLRRCGTLATENLKVNWPSGAWDSWTTNHKANKQQDSLIIIRPLQSSEVFCRNCQRPHHHFSPFLLKEI